MMTKILSIRKVGFGLLIADSLGELSKMEKKILLALQGDAFAAYSIFAVLTCFCLDDTTYTITQIVIKLWNYFG